MLARASILSASTARRVLPRHFSLAGFAKDEDGMYNVSTKVEWDAIVATGKPVVGDFWAPWCGKCRQISGFVEILAEDYPNVAFVKMNTGEEGVQEIKAALGVEVLPTFRFFNGGAEVGTPVTGYKKTPLEDQVKALAAA
ncbi:thioredoxin-dependent peroxide reductase [Achlya hypogyna]|uniref:Thioredoxin-dependent peroxide reductase n=1 Tax=Achlya hypogyna TaxID=1202772 RepID=A0A1V9YJT9_ACHHY|nr:thioredoxin-dependent peroxide reductase [Achlya hypogyna]